MKPTVIHQECIKCAEVYNARIIGTPLIKYDDEYYYLNIMSASENVYFSSGIECINIIRDFICDAVGGMTSVIRYPVIHMLFVDNSTSHSLFCDDFSNLIVISFLNKKNNTLLKCRRVNQYPFDIRPSLTTISQFVLITLADHIRMVNKTRYIPSCPLCHRAAPCNNQQIIINGLCRGSSIKSISDWLGMPTKQISGYKRKYMNAVGARNNYELLKHFNEISW